MKLQLQEILKRPIADLTLTKELTKCSPEISMEEVVKILQASAGGSIVIIEDGKTVGIFTERDFLKKVAFNNQVSKDTKISAMMTKNPVCVKKHETLGQVLLKMRAGRFRHIVINDVYDIAEGMISMRDIMDYLTDAMAEYL